MLHPTRTLWPANPACAIYVFPSDFADGPCHANHGNISIRSSSAGAHSLTLPSSKIMRRTSMQNLMAKSAAQTHQPMQHHGARIVLTLDAGQQRRRDNSRAAYQWLWSLDECWQRTTTKDASEATSAGAYNNNIPSRLDIKTTSVPGYCSSSPALAAAVTDTLELGAG